VLGFSTVLTHRIATHLDAVGVVDQPVEVAVRQRRITDLFVPGGPVSGNPTYPANLCPFYLGVADGDLRAGPFCTILAGPARDF
jgi:hypothetical protein